MPRFLEVSDKAAAKAAINADFYVSVADYGAVGDGVTDNTDAIHDARDAAGSGGVVFFPQGTYLVNPLTASVAGQTWLLDGATLQYDGPAEPNGAGSASDRAARASLLTITAAGVTVVGGTLDMTGTPVDPDAWQGHTVFVREDGATIRDLTLIGSPSHGVYAENVSQFSITGCTVKEFGWYGIMVHVNVAETTQSDFLIADNYIIADTYLAAEMSGVYVRAEPNLSNCSWSRARIARNDIGLPFDVGLSGPDNAVFGGAACIVTTNGADYTVEGNVMRGGWGSISAPNATRAAFCNNLCFGFYSLGIEIAGIQFGTTVTGNVIDGDGQGLEGGGAHLGITGSGNPATTFKNVVIAGNSITGLTGGTNGGAGIFLGNSLNVDGLSITGNMIRGGSGDDIFNGIITNCSTSNVSITGNMFDGSNRTESRGILLQSLTHIGLSVTGNNFANFGLEAVNLGPGTFTDVRVTENMVRNCGAVIGGFGVATATRLVLDSAPPQQSTATAAATTTLTASSAPTQRFTGTSTQTVVLPTTEVIAGQQFTLVNASTGAVTVNASGGSTVLTLPGKTTVTVTALQATPTTNAHWQSTPAARPRTDAILAVDGTTVIDVTSRGTSAVNYLEIANHNVNLPVEINTKSDVSPHVNLAIGTQGMESIFYLNVGGTAVAELRRAQADVVNRFRIENAATGQPILIRAVGDDTNIDINAQTKGTGQLLQNGVPVATKLTGTATLDFGSVTAASFADLTITVTGAATGDAVALGTPTAAITAGIAFTAWVSATNTVTVRAHNYTAGALDPASGTFRATIIR